MNSLLYYCSLSLLLRRQCSPAVFFSFACFRTDVDFKEIAKEVDIVPLLPHLSFITNKSKWGFMFRTGFFSIPKADFQLIQEKLMGG
jgi:hypothetical protein